MNNLQNPEPDTFFQYYRGLECHCCQQHFGYQSRTRKELLYCSFNCLSQDINGEEMVDRDTLKVSNSSTSHESRRKLEVGVGAEALRAHNNATSYNDRLECTIPLTGQILFLGENSTCVPQISPELAYEMEPNNPCLQEVAAFEDQLKEMSLVNYQDETQAFQLEESSFSDYKVEEGEAPNSENMKKSEISGKLGWIELEIGSHQIFQITHISSSCAFYAQTFAGHQMAKVLLDEISQKLTKGALLPLKQLRIGDPCLAPFFGIYYRAEIIDIQKGEPHLCRVFFCDYGNEEDVNANMIFELDPALALMNRCVVKCTWHNALASLGEPDMQAILDAEKRIPVMPKAKIADGQYLVSFQGDLPQIRLELELASCFWEHSLKNTPRRKSWNIKDCKYSSNLKDNAKVRIGFVWEMCRYLVNSIEDAENCQKLYKLIDKGEYRPLFEYVPEIGDILLGLYEGSYYRGHVTKIWDDKAQLQFLDFGDEVTAEFKDLRIPSEELMEIPIYGMTVALDDVGGVGVSGGASAKAEEVNNIITSDTVLVLKFKTEPGNNAKVTLWISVDKGKEKSLNSLVKKMYDTTEE